MNHLRLITCSRINQIGIIAIVVLLRPQFFQSICYVAQSTNVRCESTKKIIHRRLTFLSTREKKSNKWLFIQSQMDFAMTQLLMFFVIHEKLNGSQSIDKLHASNFHVNIFTIRWIFRLEFRFVKEAGRQADRRSIENIERENNRYFSATFFQWK